MNFFKYKKYLKHNLKIALSLLLSCGALGPEDKEKSLKLMDKVDNLLETAEEVVKIYKRERTPLSEEVVEKQLEAKAAAAAAEEAKKAAEEAQAEADRKQQEAEASKSATSKEAEVKAAAAAAEEAKKAESDRIRQAQIEQHKKQEAERIRKKEERDKTKQAREEEQRQVEGRNKNRYKEKILESVKRLETIISSITNFEEIGNQKGSTTTTVSGQDIEDKVTGPIYDSFTGNSGIFETWAEGFTYTDSSDIYDEIENARGELRKKIKEGKVGNEHTKTTVDVKDIQTELSKLNQKLQKFKEYLNKPENDDKLKKVIDQCTYFTC